MHALIPSRKALESCKTQKYRKRYFRKKWTKISRFFRTLLPGKLLRKAAQILRMRATGSPMGNKGTRRHLPWRRYNQAWTQEREEGKDSAATLMGRADLWLRGADYRSACSRNGIPAARSCYPPKPQDILVGVAACLTHLLPKTTVSQFCTQPALYKFCYPRSTQFCKWFCRAQANDCSRCFYVPNASPKTFYS